MNSVLASQPSFPLSYTSCSSSSNRRRNTRTANIATATDHSYLMLSSFKSKLSRKASDAKQESSTNLQNPPRASVYQQQPTRRPRNQDNMNASPSEPPPAYTPAPAAPSTAPTNQTTTPATTEEEDSAYSFLSTFDTIFLIDDSGSMAGRSWRETSQALETITPLCTRHDADGIDIYFLNTPQQPHHTHITAASTIHEIFSAVRPAGGTPTALRLNSILKPYLRQLEREPDTKPVNLIVITDGVPSDDVESVLIATAKKLDALDAAPWQVGVQFFQVGEEEGAAEHLAGLDDELAALGGGCRDIVDTVPFVRSGPAGRGNGLTGEAILKVVLGAVNRRLDRRANTAGVVAGAGR